MCMQTSAQQLKRMRFSFLPETHTQIVGVHNDQVVNRSRGMNYPILNMQVRVRLTASRNASFNIFSRLIEDYIFVCTCNCLRRMNFLVLINVPSSDDLDIRVHISAQFHPGSPSASSLIPPGICAASYMPTALGTRVKCAGVPACR